MDIAFVLLRAWKATLVYLVSTESGKGRLRTFGLTGWFVQPPCSIAGPRVLAGYRS